jgi:hypothetical protein
MSQIHSTNSTFAPDSTWKTRAFAFYEKHEVRLSIAFFLGGFLFDVVTLSDIDDPWSILQQFVYLLLLGGILVYDFLHGEEATLSRGFGWMKRAWGYRGLGFHFLLGSLFSLYSLFFLKSASFFSSIVFVLVLVAIMVANELPVVQKRGADTKIALFVVCVFCFFSMIFPILLGFVGRVPFLLSLAATGLFLYGFYLILRARVAAVVLKRRLLAPGMGVAAVFALFYLVGWIPPVPLSAVKMGVYHRIEKAEGQYLLHHERPWWKFWKSGDQDFRAEPGDKVFFFASIFSPARFDDQVILHWLFKDPRQGWITTDQIPMRVTGGREGGYRGFTSKANFQPGDWRVSVETTDRREIGRLYFTVELAESGAEASPAPGRVFEVEKY